MQQLKMVKVGRVSKNDTCMEAVNLDREICAEETLAIIRSWQPDIRDGFIKFIKEYALYSSEEKNELWRAVIPEFRRMNIPIMTAIADKLEHVQDEYEKKLQNSLHLEGGMI